MKSSEVAEKFGKEHKNVLQSIRNLECSNDFALLNFQQCFRINELANGRREPYYEMTRDGFSFLCMGFTGKDAARNQIKAVRRSFTDTVQAFVDYAKHQGSGSARSDS